MAKEEGTLNWGVERRLEFFEFRLFWERHVNRGDLINTFGISVNQSSTDLNRHLSFAPENMEYDKSAKTYVRKSSFEAQFLKPDASRYLSQLRSMGEGIIDASDSWIGALPEFDSAPTPARGVNEVTLRTVVNAIRRLGLDTDPSARKPQDQQIVLLNSAELSILPHALPSSPRMEG